MNDMISVNSGHVEDTVGQVSVIKGEFKSRSIKITAHGPILTGENAFKCLREVMNCSPRRLSYSSLAGIGTAVSLPTLGHVTETYDGELSALLCRAVLASNVE